MTVKDVFWDNNQLIQNLYWKIQPCRILYTISPEFAAKLLYRVCCGKKLDLKNPKTFNEKIQWLKLYDSTPLKTQLADKYLVKQWVAEKIGDEYIIPTLGVWDSFDEIDFDSLPDQFVLKATHGSGMNVIVRNKATFDRADAKKKFDRWMKRNLGWHSLELHYVGIKPQIMAEEYIENSDGNLSDYKIHCFSGVAKYIQYISGRATHNTHEGFFDRSWSLMPFTYTYPQFEVPIAKPNDFDKLLSLSGTLSEPFSYVRVDFYVLNNGSFKFGEITFAPASGFDLWKPQEYDEFLGGLIHLPRDKYV